MVEETECREVTWVRVVESLCIVTCAAKTCLLETRAGERASMFSGVAADGGLATGRMSVTAEVWLAQGFGGHSPILCSAPRR